MSQQDRAAKAMTSIASVGIAGIVGYIVLAAKLGVAFAVPMGVIGLVAVTLALRSPLASSLLGRGDPTVDDETTGQLLAELDELRGRMQELEERVDFSERLLAEQSRRPGTPAGD